MEEIEWPVEDNGEADRELFDRLKPYTQARVLDELTGKAEAPYLPAWRTWGPIRIFWWVFKFTLAILWAGVFGVVSLPFFVLFFPAAVILWAIGGWPGSRLIHQATKHVETTAPKKDDLPS